MFYSKYSHLSDKEFLSLIDDKRSHSPIIAELCNRLENYIYPTEELPKNTIYINECPVCESELAKLIVP